MDRDERVFAAVAGGLILLNLATFSLAFPSTSVLNPGCCAPAGQLHAKDFSAFYLGSWRLFNDPSTVYLHGGVSGEPAVLGPPEQYKYLPSFLIFVSPFLLLPYQQALTSFDVLQLLLLPVIAYLVYALTKERGLVAASLLAVVALLLPSPLPGWGLSAAYFWQWEEAQSKVLETFLLLLCFYFGKKGRPGLSGLVLGLTVFDPRFTAISIPLFLTYNRARLRRSLVLAGVAGVVANLPLLVPGVLAGFVAMIEAGGAATPLYYYSWIPLATVAVLTALEWRSVVSCFRGLFKGGRTDAEGAALEPQA